MPKLPSLTPKEIAKALERKGYILDRTKGSTISFFTPKLGKE
jgi:predicted RNA binding protein YcfA (HicA-like mRNA interferase family)